MILPNMACGLAVRRLGGVAVELCIIDGIVRYGVILVDSYGDGQLGADHGTADDYRRHA